MPEFPDRELDARLNEREIADAEADGVSLARLLKILKILRGPEGCPWDREQTHESLRPYLLEECHEVVEAIDSGDMDSLREELGDLGMHVAFQAEIAEERGDFRLSDSLDHICAKLLRRHPHVFGDAQAADAAEVERLWERIKARETKDGKRRDSILDGLPSTLPGLLRAQRIQEKVAGVGFEWATVEGALDKLREEFAEFEEALAGGTAAEREEEFGDFLFSIVNVARYLGVSPEDGLRRTNGKFIRRFAALEQRMRAAGEDIAESDLERMDAHWEAVKREEKAGGDGR